MTKITLAQLRDIIREAVEDEYKPTELEMMASVYSDMYKELYGVRPRHQDFTSWSSEKLQEEMDYIQKELEAENAKHSAQNLDRVDRSELDSFDPTDPFRYL